MVQFFKNRDFYQNSYVYIFLKGMKKMVINHIEKIFVTSDAATIMKEVSFLFLFVYF